jgi:hypothetical protein
LFSKRPRSLIAITHRQLREQTGEPPVPVSQDLIQPISSKFDSFQLWRTICNSKILAGITFIIIFNKMDLLAKKLEAGIKFKDFVTSYKDKPNDADNISKCKFLSVALSNAEVVTTAYVVATDLRQKFAGIHKELSPTRRPLFSHVTCAIDSQATSIVLIRSTPPCFAPLLFHPNSRPLLVREILLRMNLRQTELI